MENPTTATLMASAAHFPPPAGPPPKTSPKISVQSDRCSPQQPGPASVRHYGRQQHRNGRTGADDDDDNGGDDDGVPDEWVPDPVAQREFGVSAMSFWRWDHDAELIALGWPPPLVIRKRKFRSRRALNQFKATIMRRAITRRASDSTA